MFQNKISLTAPACAAAGQSGLMALYDAMFTQYGLKSAQILLTYPDLAQEFSRNHLRQTVLDLLKLNIIPIINANDAIAPHQSDSKSKVIQSCFSQKTYLKYLKVSFSCKSVV